MSNTYKTRIIFVAGILAILGLTGIQALAAKAHKGPYRVCLLAKVPGKSHRFVVDEKGKLYAKGMKCEGAAIFVLRSADHYTANSPFKEPMETDSNVLNTPDGLRAILAKHRGMSSSHSSDPRAWVYRSNVQWRKAKREPFVFDKKTHYNFRGFDRQYKRYFHYKIADAKSGLLGSQASESKAPKAEFMFIIAPPLGGYGSVSAQKANLKKMISTKNNNFHRRMINYEMANAVYRAPNLAKGKKASQSSTGFGAPAGRAVDGINDGYFGFKSVSHTTHKTQPWWQVDLGAVYKIDDIKIYNRTDCCGKKLNGAYVMVSDWPFDSYPIHALKGDSISRYRIKKALPSNKFKVNRTGRYIRVQVPRNEYLHLAEVIVRGLKKAVKPRTKKPTSTFNLARGKKAKASQHSTAFSGPAARAIDGNTNGDYGAKSVSHTDKKKAPWWQVDLGGVYKIEKIRLFNRTDCCTTLLSSAVLMVSDWPLPKTSYRPTKGDGISTYKLGTAKPFNSFKINRTGRYVRVQLTWNKYLHLAEVEVLGANKTVKPSTKPRPKR